MESWAKPYLPPTKFRLPPLELRDSYSGKLFQIRDGGVYVCGITPYDATHLGHAATYLSFDLISRFFIDDPLLERARRDSVEWQELAESQVQLYRDDMTALRVLPPDHFLSVIENMELIISYIEKLISTGKTYSIDGDVYLDISLVEGALENLPLSNEEAIRVFKERGGDPDRPGKRNPLDTLIWMKQRPDEPGWNSPFGAGRPGWHIECVALALSSLDKKSDISIEIQGGGSDLRFPHHYMTGVQAKAITGRTFSSVYAHTGMIGLNGEKMSKSRGNLVFVSDLLKNGVDPNALRIALLKRHYSKDLMWSDEKLTDAEKFLERLNECLSREEVAPTDDLIKNISQALAEDLDTVSVFSLLESWCVATESGEKGGNAGELSRELDLLLGLAL
jgi:L-cysteine:1D-myo-inositol 2-amino-2-deoxy-alpha-D-glucopyranoside ligase